MLISHMTYQKRAMFLCRQCSHPQHLPTAVQWSSRGSGMAWVDLAEVDLAEVADGPVSFFVNRPEVAGRQHHCRVTCCMCGGVMPH